MVPLQQQLLTCEWLLQVPEHQHHSTQRWVFGHKGDYHCGLMHSRHGLGLRWVDDIGRASFGAPITRRPTVADLCNAQVIHKGQIPARRTPIQQHLQFSWIIFRTIWP